MQDRKSRRFRLRMSVAVLAMTLVVAGVPVSAGATEAASPENPSTGIYPNDVSNLSTESFEGYVGYSGSDGLAATAATEDSGRSKSEGLGPVGVNPADAQDVPGSDPPGEPDAGDLSDAFPLADGAYTTDEVRAAVADGGTARVTVLMRTAMHLEAELSPAEIGEQRASIADALDGLASTLEGTGSTELVAFDVAPAAVYDITETGLEALLGDPSVASVTLDGEVQSQLDSSTGVIDSDLLNTAGVLGDNFNGSSTGPYQVAIIDSGVDGQHNAFTGRIVAQGCFVTNFSCPAGTNVFIGAPGGEECTHSTDCDHGTHVGGIAAGSFYTNGHEGVARGARIIALKVAQDDPAGPRWTAFFSAIDQALQHLINLKNTTNPNLVAVNLSIGTGATFTAGNPACNNVNPLTNVLFGQLQALGVAVVVAAGNNGSNVSMSFPGCLSNAFAIGATNDSDVPAGFTNSSAGLRWWAPGVGIVAPVPTGDSEGSKDGTSMAAPHVAGAFTLLRECVDGNGIPQTSAAAAADLDATGVNVTRNGVTRKRINVLDAATRNVNNNDFAFPEILPANPGAAGFNDFDFNVCADWETGEPGPFSLDNSIWWRWTPSATGTATISTEDGGGFVTTFDTTLTVYTGNTLATLVPIASDDDSGTGLRSLVRFPVNAGTTYQIKVDGFAAQNGLLNLHLENGPPPLCFGVPATIVGTAGNDIINGTAGNDVIVGGDGNDTINGLGGNDRICGDAGNDTINGGNGDELVLGGPGADVINGDAGNDVLVGNAGAGDVNDGNDTINGGPGNDFLDGWVGNDTLSGGPGNDQLRGEAGVDLVTYASSPGPVNASLTTNTATGDGNDTFVLVERLSGSAFNDTLIGDAGTNVLWGRGGNDVLDGRAGNDSLVGGAGNDRLIGRDGNDAFNGEGDVDTVSFEFSPAAVNVNLTTGIANGEGADTIANVENVIGSPFADNIAGNTGANRLEGRNGNDAINGGAGSDVIDGGLGNDVMIGGADNDLLIGRAGADTYNGQGGIDTASFQFSAAGVTVNLTAGTATGEGANALVGVENVIGSDLADSIGGNAAANRLEGRNGNDSFVGAAGNDLILGGAGNDRLAGGDGNDDLRGGDGDDRISGGNGNDNLRGEAGNDNLFGDAGVDNCNGGPGVDTAATCEVVVGVP